MDKVNDLVKEFGIRVSDGTVKAAIEDMGGSGKRFTTHGKLPANRMMYCSRRWLKTWPYTRSARESQCFIDDLGVDR